MSDYAGEIEKRGREQHAEYVALSKEAAMRDEVKKSTAYETLEQRVRKNIFSDL